MRKRNLITLSILTLSLFFSIEKDVFAAATENYISPNAPDSFVTNKAGRVKNGSQYDEDSSNDAVMANTALYTAGLQNVIDYHTSDKKKIFCMDRTKAYGVNETYVKEKEIDDKRVIYLITHAQDYVKKTVIPANANFAEFDDDLTMSWFTQISLWRYLNQNNFTSIAAPNVTGVVEDGTEHQYGRWAVTLWGYSQYYVDSVNNLNDSQLSTIASGNNNITIDFTNNITCEVSEDGTVKTNTISVSNSYDLESFSLDLSRAPSGTQVYSSTGAQLNPNNIPADTSFYLTFKVDNAKNYSFSGSVSATGVPKNTFLKGYQYKNQNNGTKQPVVLITEEKGTAGGSFSFEGSHVEETASFASKMMYMSGLFILLCGVGIIYASVKPNKQEI